LEQLYTSNSIHEEVKNILNSGNACYQTVKDLMSSSLLPKNMKTKIYRIGILPVVLCGRETWSLALREKHELSVFENRMVRKILAPMRDEVIGGWRRLRNEQVYDMYSSLNVIRVIKLRRMR
jgi:hypothetical protein